MSNSAVETKVNNKIKIKEPSKYNVIMLNDNITPFEFVIGILTDIFHHSDQTAKELTEVIHNHGSAIVGTYPYEIAEQKGLEATRISRKNKYPLEIKLEENV